MSELWVGLVAWKLMETRGYTLVIQTLGRLQKPACPTLETLSNTKQNQIKGTGERWLGRLLISDVS